MVFMGIDSDLHAGVSNNTAVDTIVQTDGHFMLDLVYLAVHCSSADDVRNMSKMRQQVSYA